jgi:hypothetical protein
MGFKRKTLQEYLEKIPEEYRNNLIILGDFCGKRTRISFQFSCGCKVEQVLQPFLARDRFDFCTSCKVNHQQVYTCSYCLTEFTRYNHYESCERKCKEKHSNLVLGKDYIICKICGYHGRSLKMHVSKHHNLSKKEYNSKYGSLICTSSNEKYSEAVKESGNWIIKAKEQGKDLTEYWEKVSKGVKNSIMSDDNERKRRSDLMTELNKKQQLDPDFQRKVSETAKKTSARKDVQEKRAQQLKAWRDNNPEDFHKKCISKMLLSWQSKPEKCLFNWLQSIEGFSFKRNKFIRSENFSSISKRRQSDISDKIKRIYVEFDGIFHFEPKFGEEKLKLIQQKDKEIEEHIFNHNWTLIRVSHDQFCYSTKIIDKVKIDSSYFKQECLDKILEILNSNIPGIYKIGSAYCTQPSVEL